MFELLSLIIIERGGEDKRTHGLGGLRHQEKRGWSYRGGERESHLCERKREKTQGDTAETETHGETENNSKGRAKPWKREEQEKPQKGAKTEGAEGS